MINENGIVLAPEKYYTFSRDGWYLLYDPVNVIWIRLNKDGVKIVELIKEFKNIDSIIPILAKEYTQQSKEEVQDKVQLFTNNLVSVGFLHKGQYKMRPIRHFFQEVPSEIYLLMTYKCNLRCKYCYNIEDRTEFDKYKYKYLTYKDYLRLVDEAGNLGVKKFVFTGGEPLLNHHTLRLGDYIVKKGLESELITNGLLINKANAEKISESFNIITISLDSVNKKLHEHMRGKNTFEKIIRSVGLLKAYNARIRINSVITNVNVNTVLNTWRWVIEELDCSHYTPALYAPGTNDPKFYKRFLPDMKSLIKEQDNIRKYFKDKPGIAVKYPNIRFSCGIANGEISVGPEGFVYPCHTLHKPEMRCGNLMVQNLERILKESEILKRLREFNVNEIEVCNKCDFKYLCGGGCLSMNYNIYGDFYSNNNFYCKYLKQEQIERMWTSSQIPLSHMKKYLEDSNFNIINPDRTI
ncbi:MAG: radical SAM protein [Candidatus Aminicenantes bacterium]|nr:radical SAM protein [Candidatus Aminicenantes bacterium]